MILDSSKSYVLYWSAGLDSTLLLAMLREQSQDFSIIQYRQFWTKEQARKADELIKAWDLKVFSYPMANVNFIGKGGELSAVFEMAHGGGRIPIIADLIDGTRCLEDLNDAQRMEMPPMKFDVHIVGSRKNDVHYALTKVIPSERWIQNGVEMWAPLYDYTRSAVKRDLRARKLDDSEVSDETNTGNASFCHACIKGTGTVFCPRKNRLIDSVNWDRQTNLTQFQNAYGF